MTDALMDDRIDLRMSRRIKELIERAAMIENISLSAFVVGNATFGAKQVIKDEEERVAAEQTRREFVRVVESPHSQPPPER